MRIRANDVTRSVINSVIEEQQSASCIACATLRAYRTAICAGMTMGTRVEDDDKSNGAMKLLLAVIIVAALLSRRCGSPLVIARC
jgi:hypothetical protein